MAKPPSTTSVWPLIMPASGRHSRNTAPATSCGVSTGPAGVRCEKLASSSSRLGKYFERVGVHYTRADRVHADAAWAQLLRQRPHQRLQRRFRCADEAVAGHRALRAQARHRDDARAGRHQRQSALREQVQRQRVGLHAPAPVLERHVHRWLQHAAGRVADQDVEPVEVLAELGEDLVDAVGNAHAARRWRTRAGPARGSPCTALPPRRRCCNSWPRRRSLRGRASARSRARCRGLRR